MSNPANSTDARRKEDASAATNSTDERSFKQLFWRALRLRCAKCGVGAMFGGYWKVHKSCDHCGVQYEREPGFFLGSVYFNYGLTALIVAVVYPVLLFSNSVDETTLLWSCLGFTILFPMWFFRYARALWAGFDQFWDPREESASNSDTTG